LIIPILNSEHPELVYVKYVKYVFRLYTKYLKYAFNLYVKYVKYDITLYLKSYTSYRKTGLSSFIMR